jgi:glycolate oxidase FAD binding subunit
MSLRGDILRRLGEIVGPENLEAENIVLPGSAEQAAAVLALANAERLRVAPAGNFSQYDPRRGPFDIVLSLRRMNALKQYQPADLTASMQAGITLEQLSAALEPHRQWLPLGAPLPARADAEGGKRQAEGGGDTGQCPPPSAFRLRPSTMGGILATNASGPFRLFYGTARDMVIGLRFATVEGKLVKSGGMVVKNVAGYDMAKLLIGSLGTLGVITDVNVRLYPRPATETMLLAFDSLAAAMGTRNAILKSVLTPLALDLLDAGAAAGFGLDGLPEAPFLLAAAYGGVASVIERNRTELASIARTAGCSRTSTLAAGTEKDFWRAVCDFPAAFPAFHPESVRLKVSLTLEGIGPLLDVLGWQASSLPHTAGKDARRQQRALVARAGTGVCYLYAAGGDLKAFCHEVRQAVAPLGGHTVIEFAPPALAATLDLWGPRRDDYAVMLKLKHTFDPNAILNPGRFVC